MIKFLVPEMIGDILHCTKKFSEDEINSYIDKIVEDENFKLFKEDLFLYNTNDCSRLILKYPELDILFSDNNNYDINKLISWELDGEEREFNGIIVYSYEIKDRMLEYFELPLTQERLFNSENPLEFFINHMQRAIEQILSVKVKELISDITKQGYNISINK